jgi:hypothetical protein
VSILLAHNVRNGSVRERAVAGAAMIVGTSLSIQLAASIAHDLFDRLSPVGPRCGSSSQR